MDLATMAFRRRRRPCCLLLPPLLLLLSLLAVGLAAGGPGDIAVFWGRNKDEGTLREACDTGTYNTVLISFLTAFGHGGSYSLDLSGHPLAAVGDDIKHCQSKGILVLLSIGGPVAGAGGSNYSLPSAQSAADLADHLWNAYLGGRRACVPRPFGDTAVDGVDFFIDQGSGDHYDKLARRLYSYNKQYHRGGGRPAVALTATGLFGRIHVRLYGGDVRCTWAAREAWEKWAAAYPGSLVFVGVVASPEADQDAYMSQKDLYYNVLQFAQKAPNYGGIMIWNRYYDKKTGYMGG